MGPLLPARAGPSCAAWLLAAAATFQVRAAPTFPAAAGAGLLVLLFDVVPFGAIGAGVIHARVLAAMEWGYFGHIEFPHNLMRFKS